VLKFTGSRTCCRARPAGTSPGAPRRPGTGRGASGAWPCCAGAASSCSRTSSRPSGAAAA